MALMEELKSLLKKDDRVVSEGNLLKNRIVELALKLDKDLIKLLLSNKKIKEHFFTDVEGTLIFDKEKFMKFIDNKEFLPDSYTAFKNKIGLTADGNYISKSKEVVLAWPYKDCVLEGGQEKEDEKRKEIFYNTILAPDEIDRLLEPKVFTNFKRIDAKGEHKVTEIKPTDNLIIKGNNLLVLHSLKKRFAGKVKLIYIDPPYNTGNDEFKYNDNFNHSTWLTFMKNRLEVARELLREDGVIFVQIDSEERDYLKIILDEIFARENYLNNVVVRKKQAAGVGQDAFLLDTIEYILIYAKSKSKFLKTKEKQYMEFEFDDELMDDYSLYVKNFGERNLVKEITDARGEKVKIYQYKNIEVKKVENNEKEKRFYLENFYKFFLTYGPQSSLMKKVIKNLPDKGFYEIEYIPSRGKNVGVISQVNFYNKRIVQWLKDIAYIKETKIIKKQVAENLWTDISWDVIGPEGDVELKSGKKPEALLKRIIEISTQKGDLVLDFFLGSGTTCAVAHKMGRQYIGIEQLDYGENSAVVRLKNVINGDQTGISKAVNWQGGGDFVYMELKELNEEFVQKIMKAKDSKELLKIWEEMKQHAFLSYRVDEKLFDDNIEEFKKLSAEEQKKLLIECLDANNLYVNYSEMKDTQYNISKEDIELNNKFYKGL
ncbi:MAG: site-specific DNA-methyltransferase [Candidatus Pacearchaeota archaeon]